MVLLTSTGGHKVAIRAESVVAVAIYEVTIGGVKQCLTGIFMSAGEHPDFVVTESPTEVAGIINEDIRKHEGWIMERQKLLWP